MGWKEGTVFLDTGFSYTTSNQASIGTIWWSDTIMIRGFTPGAVYWVIWFLDVHTIKMVYDTHTYLFVMWPIVHPYETLPLSKSRIISIIFS